MTPATCCRAETVDILWSSQVHMWFFTESYYNSKDNRQRRNRPAQTLTLYSPRISCKPHAARCTFAHTHKNHTDTRRLRTVCTSAFPDRCPVQHPLQGAIETPPERDTLLGVCVGRGGSAFIAFLFAPRPIFMAPPDDAAASPKDAVKVDLSEVASTRPKPPNKPPPPKPSKPAPQPPVRTSAAEPPHVPKPPLPEGWKVLKTPEGKTYYYNKSVRNVPPLSCLMMTTPISFQTFNVDKIHACRY